MSTPEKPSYQKLVRDFEEASRQLSNYRRSERKLRAMETHLKAMVEAFDGLIYICSQDYRVEYMNEKYIERIGYDATGELCYKALHSRNSACPWCLNDRIFKGETVRCEVLTHRSRWYRVVSTPIFHSDGSVSKHAMIIDISDRKKAEITLKEKVEEQELLLDNIQTQIWYLTDAYTYGAVNKAHARFFGVKKQAIVGRSLYGVLQKETADLLVPHNMEVFEKKTPAYTEKWILNGNGDKRLLSIHITPKLDGSGKVEYAVCSGEDITDYRNSEIRLRESKKRLDLAMEATSDALWDWDLKTNRTYYNASFYTMLGYAANELPQSFESWKALIHPEDRKTALLRIEAYVQKKVGKLEVEYRLKTKQGGWKWIMARGQVVDRDDNGTPVRMVGTHVDITQRKLNEEALRQSEAHLRQENLRLRSTLKSSNQFGAIIGRSAVMHDVYEVILKSALTGANVIIYGESGTGKELVAQTIHELSDRSGRAFVTVNCGAIPDNLIESEFFGYKKGAFTGAEMDKPGFLDSADAGTLFMDEVGELDLNMQVKLLRAIEGGGHTPIGSREIKRPDVRIIAATNRDLKRYLKKGRMREDFYYRIHIIPIHLPPLRERREDLPLLIHHFLQMYSNGQNIPPIAAGVMRSMQQYDWPGNVRELQNTIHRYITLNKIDFMNIAGTPAEPPTPDARQWAQPEPAGMSLQAAKKEFEKQYIGKVLSLKRWHRGKASSALGINRKTLFKKIKEHSLLKTT